jgi:hypothetical protein
MRGYFLQHMSAKSPSNISPTPKNLYANVQNHMTTFEFFLKTWVICKNLKIAFQNQLKGQ